MTAEETKAFVLTLNLKDGDVVFVNRRTFDVQAVADIEPTDKTPDVLFIGLDVSPNSSIQHEIQHMSYETAKSTMERLVAHHQELKVASLAKP